MVRGSGNAFRDLGHKSADAEQFKAILAAEIIKALDRERLTVRAAHGRTGIAAARLLAYSQRRPWTLHGGPPDFRVEPAGLARGGEGEGASGCGLRARGASGSVGIGKRPTPPNRRRDGPPSGVSLFVTIS